MSWLTKYLKNFKYENYFKNFKYENYLKIYENADVNEFFWNAWLSGGILRCKKVDKSLKNLWLAYQILSTGLVLSLNICGFLYGDEKNLSTILILLRPISGVSMLILTYTVFVHYYESLEKYIEDLDEYLSASSSCDDRQQRSNEYKFFNVFVVILLGLAICIKGYAFYFPFVDEDGIESKAIMVLVFAMGVMPLIPILLLIFCGLSMVYIFVKLMSSTFDELQQQMKTCSIWTLEALEFSHNRELEIEANDLKERDRVAYLFIERRNKIYENFDKNIAYFAKQHEKLVGIHFQIAKFFEIICSTTAFGVCSMQIFAGIDVVQALHSNRFDPLIIPAFATFLMLLHVFNELCRIASVIDTTMDNFSNQVYSLPWYLLPKKSRKMVYLLMVQTQRSPRIRVFNTWILGAPLVPKILNLCSSYISVLRILLEKSK